jgi:hypothetical protein
MSKLEAQPTEGSIAAPDWQHERNSIQIELMERMGVPIASPQDATQKNEQRDAVDSWVGLYAKKFADITGQNTKLQDQLMSSDEIVKHSALEEIIHSLKEDKSI